MAAAAMIEAGRIEDKLDELLAQVGPYFSRVEPLRQVGKYLRGLMSDLPRKNCWTLAEYVCDRTPDRMQRLLERASWNTFAVMRAVRDFVVTNLATADGLTVLVLDESRVEKTGDATAGVKRQYVGCAGKVANAVNLVNATYSTARGHALVGSRLYLPAEQVADQQQRTRLGIPAATVFKTKPQLGLELLTEQVAAGIHTTPSLPHRISAGQRRHPDVAPHTATAVKLPCQFEAVTVRPAAWPEALPAVPTEGRRDRRRRTGS